VVGLLNSKNADCISKQQFMGGSASITQVGPFFLGGDSGNMLTLAKATSKDIVQTSSVKQRSDPCFFPSKAKWTLV
jgi:hypothetical protein